MLLRNVVAVSLAVFVACSSQAVQYSEPKWLSAKWTMEDDQFKVFRIKLDKIKFAGPVDEKVANDYYDKYVTPFLKDIKRYSDHPELLKLKPIDLYRIVALYAYFPGTAGKYGLIVSPLIEFSDGLPSYEFARVAFSAYVIELDYRPMPTNLAKRLLDKDSKDLLVRLHVVRMANRLQKYDEWMKRGLTTIDELVEECPARAGLMLGLAADTYYRTWHRSADPNHIKKAVAYIDRMMKEVKDLGAHRDVLKENRAGWVKEAKAKGIDIK